MTNINGPTEDPIGSIWYLTVSNSVGLGEWNPGCKCFSHWERSRFFGWAATIEPRLLRLSRLFWAKKSCMVFD